MNKLMKLVKRYKVNKWHLIALVSVTAFLLIGILSRDGGESERVTGRPEPKNFNGGRVIATGRSLEKIRDESLRNSIDLLQENQEGLAGKLESLTKVLESINENKQRQINVNEAGGSVESG